MEVEDIQSPYDTEENGVMSGAVDDGNPESSGVTMHIGYGIQHATPQASHVQG